MKSKYHFSKGSLVAFIIIFLGSVAMLLPFFWMVMTSFKTFAETVAIPIAWIPKKFMFSNYVDVMQKMNFSLYYRNTAFMSVCVVSVQLFLCALAAYSFADLKFPAKNFLFTSLLVVLMVPPQMTLLPRYLMMDSFGWVDSFSGLIIPLIPSAYGTFFLRQFFMTLPSELEDSAKIDGCSYFRTFWNILLPLCTSALIAYGIFTFLATWNDLLWPLIITNSESYRVLSIALSSMQGSQGTKYQLLMAASVLATIPTISVFMIGQKYFIKGIALSGIKG